MVARMWRGWAAADDADAIAADSGRGRSRASVGVRNVSTSVLLRPHGGGVEIVTLTLWESRGRRPDGRRRGRPAFWLRPDGPDTWCSRRGAAQLRGERAPAGIARRAAKLVSALMRFVPVTLPPRPRACSSSTSRPAPRRKRLGHRQPHRRGPSPRADGRGCARAQGRAPRPGRAGRAEVESLEALLALRAPSRADAGGAGARHPQRVPPGVVCRASSPVRATWLFASPPRARPPRRRRGWPR